MFDNDILLCLLCHLSICSWLNPLCGRSAENVFENSKQYDLPSADEADLLEKQLSRYNIVDINIVDYMYCQQIPAFCVMYWFSYFL